MNKILKEHDDLIAKINRQTKRNIYITIIIGSVLIVMTAYFGWYN